MIEDADLFTPAAMKLLFMLDPDHNSDTLHEDLFNHFDMKVSRLNSSLYQAWWYPHTDREDSGDCRAWVQEHNEKLEHE